MTNIQIFIVRTCMQLILRFLLNQGNERMFVQKTLDKELDKRVHRKMGFHMAVVGDRYLFLVKHILILHPVNSIKVWFRPTIHTKITL